MKIAHYNHNHAAYDFDVLVAGHLSRMGTKADAQRNKDFYDDVLEGRCHMGAPSILIVDSLFDYFKLCVITAN